MTPNRITLITLAVNDLAAAAGFYEKLGWEKEFQSDQTVFYDLGGLKFGLYLRDSLAGDLNKTPDQLGTGGTTLAQNFPEKQDVDAAYAAALAAGATALKPPADMFWGGYSGAWADPDGNVWEYAWNPFWELDSDGRIKT